MPLNVRLLRFVLIAISVLLFCFILFFHISPAAHPTALFRRSEFTLRRFRLVDDDLAVYRALLSRIRPSDRLLRSRTPPLSLRHSRTLGVASNIFVLSLPRRLDRRTSMDALSRALDLEFVYVDGTEATDASIDRVMRALRWQRRKFRAKFLDSLLVDALHDFDSTYLDELLLQHEADSPGTLFDLDLAEDPLVPAAAHDSLSMPADGSDVPLLSCATPEDPFPAPLNASEISLLPPWRVLSRGMVACWITHLEVIRMIAQGPTDTVAIVLEDDVDMEFDIEQRLTGVWPALPPDGWDIVMLGMSRVPCSGRPPFRGLYHPFAGRSLIVHRAQDIVIQMKRLTRHFLAPPPSVGPPPRNARMPMPFLVPEPGDSPGYYPRPGECPRLPFPQSAHIS